MGPSALYLSRRQAVALLGGAIGAAAFPAVAAPSLRPLFDFAIAGGPYHGLGRARAKLGRGVGLELRREPENPHDSKAVAVYFDGVRLGYVPRAANPPLAALMDAGARVEAEIVSHLDLTQGAAALDGVAFTGVSDGDPILRLSVLEDDQRSGIRSGGVGAVRMP